MGFIVILLPQEEKKSQPTVSYSVVNVHPSGKRFVGWLGCGYVAVFTIEENKEKEMIRV